MSEQKEKIAKILNLQGQECFAIRLEIRMHIPQIQIGEILKVVTDNPLTEKTLPKWCILNEQELYLFTIEDGNYIFYIKRTT
ncbi:MAG: sulfurtransferase TusA family protein [Candidatus Thorarchaeota archaeon]